jgi:uncharacterized protein (TIGR02646 family)
MPPKPLFFPRLTRQSSYPSYTQYREYRGHIRKDSQYRCVYCDVHENEINRDSNTRDEKMTIDHFRPKSSFRHLENDPNNLVLACQNCNFQKRDDFPAFGRPDGNSIDGVHGYIDPFSDDRNNYFEVESNGRLIAKKHPADYMIRVLLLNGPHKLKVRKRRFQLQDNFEILDQFFEKEKAYIDMKLLSANQIEKVNLSQKLITLQMMKTLLIIIQDMVDLY